MRCIEHALHRRSALHRGGLLLGATICLCACSYDWTLTAENRPPAPDGGGGAGAGPTSTSSASSGGGSVGSAGGGGAATTGCATNGVNTLRDTFDGNDLSSLWERTEDGRADIRVDDALIVHLPGFASDTSADVTSVATYDLTSCALFVRAVQMPTRLGEFAYLLAGESPDDFMALLLEDGALKFVVSGVRKASVPYKPDVDKLWKMGEAGGTLFWETSADGIAWERLHEEPATIALTQVHIQLAGGKSNVEATATDAVFDDLNVGP